MGWFNLSSEEAADEYYRSKSKYQNAANQRYMAKRAEENCRTEVKNAKAEIKACKSEKINFEKRIEDIKKIVGALDGSQSGGSVMGMFGKNAPELISKVNNQANETDESYKTSIKCSDYAPASMVNSFRSKSIDEDSNTSGALTKFKNEIVRLENELANLKARMNSLSSTVSTLQSKIRAYSVEQMDWQRQMSSSAYEMCHYKRYM